MFQSPLTRNVSLFLGPIYVSVSTHPECILVPWPDICFSLHSLGMCPCSLVQYMFQSPLTRNVSLFIGPIYVSVSTHPECVLVHWSNICFSLHSPGMYPCSLVQYMFQSPLTRNVSLFIGPIYVSVSTHPECILVPWSNICFSLHSPGMYPYSLVQYMFQSPLTRNVSLFLGPIYVSVSTHPECILVPWSIYVSVSTHSECVLVHWSNICFSLHSPGMCPCSMVQYMFQSPLTRNVSLFIGPIYVSVSTHSECVLVHWSNICFSLPSPGMCPCSLVQYMFQSPFIRNVSLFLGPIYVSVSTHPECVLVHWSNICFSLHSPGMYPCSLARYICFSLHSPGMYPCSLVQYMLQSPLTWNVSLFFGPIYVSVSTHPECILVHWSNICFSLHSPGMYPCSLVRYMFQSPLTRNVWSLVQYRFQSPLTRNVSLFIGPIYVSVSTHPECVLVHWSNICFSLHSPGMYDPWSNIGFSLYSPGMYPCSLVQYMFQSPLTRNVSLLLGPIYVSVSTHPECILVPWSNICFSLHSSGMYPCSLARYMFQSPLTRNVSLFIGPIYVSVSTHPECVLVHWSNICFSLHSLGMCPCSLVQYMFQSPLTRNVSLFIGPIYVSVSTHPECVLVHWSNICFSLHSSGMYPCSLARYMFQSPLTRNVSLFIGPIYVSVSTHPECILVPWSRYICFSLHSPGMYPCSLVQYMFQSPLTWNVSLFIGPIYVSVSTHPECILVHWSNICFSLHSPGMYPCSLVQYMFQSPLTRNVSLFLGPIYVSVSTHPECMILGPI